MTPAGTARVDTARVDIVCYHHRPDPTLLLLAALPAAREARRLGVHAYVERHWLHGPHVRVRLHGPRRAITEAARLVRGHFTVHLDEHPPGPGVDPAVLLARSEAAGRAELVPGPYRPIHPHGTVHRERPDDGPLAELLGRPAVRHRHRLMAAGLDAVEASVRVLHTAGDTPTTRVRVALAAVTGHAAAYPPGLLAGSTSFLSHVEDLLHREDPDGRLRARFAAAWDRVGDTVTADVHRAAQGQPPDALHRVWSAWSRTATRQARAARRRGEIPLLPGAGYRRRAQGFDDRAVVRRFAADRDGADLSAFHRRLAGQDWTAPIAEDFGPYRFTTNVLYPLLVVCGVTPMDRYLAAYLLAEAAQRLAGTTWRDAPDGWPPPGALPRRAPRPAPVPAHPSAGPPRSPR